MPPTNAQRKDHRVIVEVVVTPSQNASSLKYQPRSVSSHVQPKACDLTLRGQQMKIL